MAPVLLSSSDYSRWQQRLIRWLLHFLPCSTFFSSPVYLAFCHPILKVGPRGFFDICSLIGWSDTSLRCKFGTKCYRSPHLSNRVHRMRRFVDGDAWPHPDRMYMILGYCRYNNYYNIGLVNQVDFTQILRNSTLGNILNITIIH